MTKLSAVIILLTLLRGGASSSRLTASASTLESLSIALSKLVPNEKTTSLFEISEFFEKKLVGLNEPASQENINQIKKQFDALFQQNMDKNASALSEKDDSNLTPAHKLVLDSIFIERQLYWAGETTAGLTNSTDYKKLITYALKRLATNDAIKAFAKESLLEKKPYLGELTKTPMTAEEYAQKYIPEYVEK